MLDKGRFDDKFIWNPRICEYEFDKSCDVGKYLNYKNCKCRNRLIDKLVEEYSEEEILNTTNTISITDKNSCLIYIILLIIMCLILLSIVSVSCYYHYYTRYCSKKE